jgi:hypothetical protein
MTYSCPIIFLSYEISKAEFYGKSARTDDQRTVRTSVELQQRQRSRES